MKKKQEEKIFCETWEYIRYSWIAFVHNFASCARGSEKCSSETRRLYHYARSEEVGTEIITLAKQVPTQVSEDLASNSRKEPEPIRKQPPLAKPRQPESRKPESRKPKSRQSEHRQPEHRQPEHRQPEHRQPEHRQPEYREIDSQHAESTVKIFEILPNPRYYGRRYGIISELATSIPICSGERKRYVFVSEADITSLYVDALYDKYLFERGTRADPPSPAPQDPHLENLRRTHYFEWIHHLPFEERFRERCHPAPDEIPESKNQDIDWSPISSSPRRSPIPVVERGPTHYRRSRSDDREYRAMGRVNKLDDHERKIIIEFCHLLEKSKQLFNGLRELPPYGHKQWHAYFGKTFDVYTKLWKFQQQHRAILDSKYGLKRWQIGEIASKIGQLYYHFYLRTSDTAYLSEAFSFYYAIRGRSYYTQACKEDKCELMVKKLRYYARFIVASLLLKKGNLVDDLLKELDKQIVEYGNAYEPDDQNEWRIVADEVRSFIEVETVVQVIHPKDYVCVLSHRLSARSPGPSLDRMSPMTLTLHEALIVGSNSTQLKFSELTMDMYRMLQTLEREPNTEVQHNMFDESPRQRNPPTLSALNSKGYNLDSYTNEAPHKYMLFKPSPNQIFVYLSSAMDDLPPNGVVLLYISAEGLIVPNFKHPEDSKSAGGYDVGGLITTSKTDVLQRESLKDGKASKLRELPVLHPGDLYPFTRRPMCLIVDSDNSFVFHNLPRYFGQPVIILMSPIELPSSLYPSTGDDQRVEGSLFTLFLHDPLAAVCLCCDIKRMGLDDWERAQACIEAYLKEAGALLSRIRDCMYVSFLNDDFLRLLILRFIFCETILRMHRMFRGRAQRTRCSPPLPDDLYEHPMLTRIVIDLVSKLQVRGQFHEPTTIQRE